MRFFKNVNEDINAASRFGLTNKLVIFFFNRGFHALLIYRISNKLHRWHIPVFPLIFTRIIQIMYAIDIDYKANIYGGVVIVHGVGLVIGSGAVIGSNTIIFHGVTLGRRGIGPIISATDGFPSVEEDCIICAGAKLIGNIIIGKNSTIGANCVVAANVPPNSIFKISSDNYIIYTK
jgi:serine O-acetyltransferase